MTKAEYEQKLKKIKFNRDTEIKLLELEYKNTKESFEDYFKPLTEPFNFEGLEEGETIVFKLKYNYNYLDDDKWFTGKIRFTVPPDEKDNKWKLFAEQILPDKINEIILDNKDDYDFDIWSDKMETIIVLK